MPVLFLLAGKPEQKKPVYKYFRQGTPTKYAPLFCEKIIDCRRKGAIVLLPSGGFAIKNLQKGVRND